MRDASWMRRAGWAAAMMLLAPAIAGGQQAGAVRERREMVRKQAVPAERSIFSRSVRIGDSTYRLFLEFDQAPPAPADADAETDPGDDFAEVDEAPRAPQAQAGPLVFPAQPRLAPESFDQFIYGELSRSQARQADLERALRVRIDAASRAFRLGEADRQKLLLAGRGDIKHTLDRIEAARAEFEAARAKYQDGIKVLERSAGLAVEARKPFGLGSLYGKTLNTIAVAPGMGRVDR